MQRDTTAPYDPRISYPFELTEIIQKTPLRLKHMQNINISPDYLFLVTNFFRIYFCTGKCTHPLQCTKKTRKTLRFWEKVVAYVISNVYTFVWQKDRRENFSFFSFLMIVMVMAFAYNGYMMARCRGDLCHTNYYVAQLT